ncbi:MAG: alpha/beta fold hydrolase [Rhodanobacter sp.]|nr:MAG: alpha/beta fold hydrolase [Rhodanobacter sp.]TAM07892.1 MAG: alpha/beta fold hydrolase [Rhodanobacter sp.]TAM35224.1 MAG: alpha/beta fold hydrolase [Rhodanobacter sp.]
MLFRRLKFLAGLAIAVVVLVGGSYLFAPQWLMQADDWRQAMQAHLSQHTVQAGDTQWSYYEGGDGPTIVLLHGFDDHKSVWLPVAKQLTPHFHVVIPDLPGWGESSRNMTANYDIDAQATRLESFVHTLGLRRFLLAGHSMGGAIAGVFAAEHPDQVAALALIDSFGLKFNENAFARESLAGRDPFAFNDRASFARAAKLVFKTLPDIPGRFVDVLAKRNVANRAFINKVFNELRAPSQYLAVQNRLGQLTMPVLGLWCKDDRVIDISALDSLRNGLIHAPAISASTLTDCGHMPELEQPDDTARVLTAFALSN